MTSSNIPTTRAIQRIHDRFADELTVYQYDWDASGGTNAYADGGDWTKSSSTVLGTVSRDEAPTQTTGPDGNDVTISAIVYVDPDDVTVSVGTGDEERATEFVRESTGTRYQATVIRDYQPLLAVECQEM